MGDRKRGDAVNFAPGPAQLPIEVLLEAQQGALNYCGLGIGVMELSHRSKEYTALNKETMDLLRSLLSIPDNYSILLLQGGGTAQFAAIPLNLTQSKEDVVDYLVTGTWSNKAVKEAEKYCKVNLALPKTSSYTSIPDPQDWKLSPNAKYVYYCSNETVHGVEFPYIPETGDVPLVCDASSNFLTRPKDISKHAVVYAGAQKNVGCAGVTIVIVRNDILGKPRPECPVFIDYTAQNGMKSVYNTPCVWGVYILNLVLKWVQKQGGVPAMECNSAAKCGMVMDIIARSEGFYRVPVEPRFRSRVNVPFRIFIKDEPSPELEEKFIKEADEVGLIQLKGHRSVGGLRVSLYNAVTLEQTKRLFDFMKQFHATNSVSTN